MRITVGLLLAVFATPAQASILKRCYNKTETKQGWYSDINLCFLPHNRGWGNSVAGRAGLGLDGGDFGFVWWTKGKTLFLRFGGQDKVRCQFHVDTDLVLEHCDNEGIWHYDASMTEAVKQDWKKGRLLEQ